MLVVTIHNVYVQTQTAVTAKTPTVTGKIPVTTVRPGTNDWNVERVSTVVRRVVKLDKQLDITIHKSYVVYCKYSAGPDYTPDVVTG